MVDTALASTVHIAPSRITKVFADNGTADGSVTLADVLGLLQGADIPSGVVPAVGTTAGTVAAGDDTRIVGALQSVTAATTYAPLASPMFTGIPKAPTAALGTSTVQVATMAALQAAMDALVAGAPGTLDTLNEIATQLASDESAAAALTTTVASKLAKTANLSDLSSATITRTNLGLGTAATFAATAFVAAGTAMNLPVSNTYTASGAIAIADSLAIVNAAAAVVMTLANGTIDGHQIVVKRWGAGTVSLAARIDNSAQTLAMSNTAVQESITLCWSTPLASYVLI